MKMNKVYYCSRRFGIVYLCLIGFLVSAIYALLDSDISNIDIIVSVIVNGIIGWHFFDSLITGYHKFSVSDNEIRVYNFFNKCIKTAQKTDIAEVFCPVGDDIKKFNHNLQIVFFDGTSFWYPMNKKVSITIMKNFSV